MPNPTVSEPVLAAAKGAEGLSLDPPLAPAVRRVLCCPADRASLTDEPGGMRCSSCGELYPIGRQIDLRPRRKCVRTASFTIDTVAQTPDIPLPECLQSGPYAACTVGDQTERWRATFGNFLTDTQTTYLPPASDGDILLDLGCGKTHSEAEVAGARGYTYAGVDYAGETAPILADAHALPFVSASVAAVISVGVQEHLANPFLASLEVSRVLRSGGTFLGVVAFLEPFHMNSYFHHTHRGVVEVLSQAELVVDGIESNDHWLGPEAILHMTAPTLLQRAVRRFGRRGLRWLYGLSRVRLRDPLFLATVTGGFRFVAHKPV